MREKIRALTNATSPIPANLAANIKKYANAQQLKQHGKYNQALRLAGNSSKKISEAILISELLNKQRRYQQSINLLTPLTTVFPGDEALSIPLAQAHLALGHAEKAWLILNEIKTSEQTSLQFFEALQETSRLSHKISQAYVAVANRNIRIGNYKAAIAQLRQAIKLPDSNSGNILYMQQLLDKITKNSDP